MKEIGSDDRRLVHRVANGHFARLIDNLGGALRRRFRPPEIHREGDIEDFSSRRGELEMDRTTLAEPLFGLTLDESLYQRIVVLEDPFAVSLDPSDRELERNSGLIGEERYQRKMDRRGLPD